MKPRKIFGLLCFVLQVILLLKLVELCESSTTTSSPPKTSSTSSSLLRRTSALVPFAPASPKNESPFGFLYDLYTGLMYDKRSSILVEGNRTEIYIPIVQLAVCAAIAVGWYFIFIRIWKYPLVGDFNKPAETTMATTAVPPTPPGMGPMDESMWDDGGDNYQTYGQSDSNNSPDKNAYSHLMYGEKKYGKV